MMARQSASERSTCTCGGLGARDRQADRLGAGRQQQPVVGNLVAVGERDFSARASIAVTFALRRRSMPFSA